MCHFNTESYVICYHAYARTPGLTLYFCITYVFTHYSNMFTLFVSLSLSSNILILGCWTYCDIFQSLLFNMFTLSLSFTSTHLPQIALTYFLQYVPHIHSYGLSLQYLLFASFTFCSVVSAHNLLFLSTDLSVILF